MTRVTKPKTAKVTKGRRTAPGKVRMVTVVLVDRDGRLVRCVPTPSTTTFLLNLEDNHYYDRQPCCGRFMRREYP